MARMLIKLPLLAAAATVAISFGTAFAADTAEVSVARPAETIAVASTANARLAGTVLAADRRTTNLRMTSNSISVQGIEDIRTRRAPR